MRLLVIAAALLAGSAVQAQELDINTGAWRCRSVIPGAPRVCGSSHSTYQPPRVIVETIERPVPVPVPDPVPVYVPQPVYPPPFYGHRPHVTYGRHEPRSGLRTRQLLPRHY